MRLPPTYKTHGINSPQLDLDCRRCHTNRCRHKEIPEKHFEVVIGTAGAPVGAVSRVIALQATIRAGLPSALRQLHHQLVRADAQTDHQVPSNP